MTEDKDSIHFEVIIELKYEDPVRLDRITKQLRSELINHGIPFVKTRSQEVNEEGTKAIDPLVLGAIVVATAPSLVTKALELLHAWAMRRQDRIVKIKIQTKAGSFVEIEVPETLSQDEVRKWIDLVDCALRKSKEK